MKVYIYQIFLVCARGETFAQNDIDLGFFTSLDKVREYIDRHIEHTAFENIEQLSYEDFDVYRHKLNVMYRQDVENPTLIKVRRIQK